MPLYGPKDLTYYNITSFTEKAKYIVTTQVDRLKVEG